MGKEAAHLKSYHECPAFDGPKAHKGGFGIKGAAKVYIEGAPALRKGDSMLCIGPIDTVSTGSSSVYIEGAPAARIGDKCAHSGQITTGCGKTFIG